MDQQPLFASRDDIWRLHTDMKHVHSVQAEHADRLLRLERRQEDDARMKSVWGTSSPFPGVLSGTPQQGPIQTPPTADFPHLDEGQRHNILGNLQLDNDDEPKRGASRANSVRFDESAIHGHWGQVSRSSSDFFPTRSGSGLGSHPLTERSSSHKSDGRHSSAGQSAHSTHSVHSTRNNSLGLDTAFSLSQDPATPFETPGPPPGLYFMGPVPSIIRCWLDETFSNDTLLYAVVCTGSCKSYIDYRLVNQLGLQDRVTRSESNQVNVRLPVYLPEALVQKPASRSSSPAPQLPSLTVNFAIMEQASPLQRRSIQVFIGSDTLKEHNADILLSQNTLSVLGNNHCRLSVPLVRPEDETLFKNLGTRNLASDTFSTMATHSQTEDSPGHFPAFAGSFAEPTHANGEFETGLSPRDDSQRGGVQLRATSPGSFFPQVAPSEVSVIGDRRKSSSQEIGDPGTEQPSLEKGQEARQHPEEGSERLKRERSRPKTEDPESATAPSSQGDASGGIWGSWRRESGPKGEHVSDSPTTASGYQRPGRGRGTKVLRPSKSSVSMPPRSFSASRPGEISEAPSVRTKDSSERPGSGTGTGTGTGMGTGPGPGPGTAEASDGGGGGGGGREPVRRALSGDVKSGAKMLRPAAGKSKTSNPIGGASAFAWLNGGGGGQQTGTTSTGE